MTSTLDALASGLGNGCAALPRDWPARRIVITGGPGAGKTAVLALARHVLCSHVTFVPEAAGVVFGGGFPRSEAPAARRHAQRAIFHVQRELEAMADDDARALVICDRGTIDGSAYWLGSGDLLSDVGTTLADELARYDLVIHLRSPSRTRGYNRSNPLRIETAETAHDLDRRILEAWSAHPRRIVVEAHRRFIDKATHVLDAIRSELPDGCRGQLPDRDALRASPRGRRQRSRAATRP